MSGYGEFRSESKGLDAEYFSKRAITAIDELNEDEMIDPVENLEKRVVFINSGKEDTSVPPHN